MSRNLAASIRARLKRHADTARQDFNLTLTHYGLERLLYPRYTVVAEKLHAICLLGMANTRMKDYFDLWVLLTEDGLEPAKLRHAVEATFARRQLPMPSTTPSGLSEAFARDAGKQRQWNAFLKKNRLDALDLTSVVTLLRRELQRLAAT